MDLRVCPNPNANLRVMRVFCSVRMAQFVLKIARNVLHMGPSARYSKGYLVAVSIPGYGSWFYYFSFNIHMVSNCYINTGMRDLEVALSHIFDIIFHST